MDLKEIVKCAGFKLCRRQFYGKGLALLKGARHLYLALKLTKV